MVEITYLAGIGFALIAAFGLGVQSVLVRLGTDTGRATDAVLIVTFVNLIVLLPAVGVLYYPDYGLTPTSFIAFIGAGITGALLGRLFKYTSIERIGAGRTAPIVSSNTVFATVIAVIALGEVLTVVHLIAILLIVMGVATISWETSQDNPQGLSRRELLLGLILPFAAAFFYGVEPVLAKIGIEHGTPALVGLVVKTLAAFLGFLMYLQYAGLMPGYAELSAVSSRWYVGAGLGNTLFVAAFYSAIAIAPVIVIYPIIPTNILFVLLLSALFLPRRLETVTWILAAASVVIVLGVGLIALVG